jgi:AcrR family transcriptional regulator
MSSDRRRYQLKARAERQRRTRERIVAATAALHAEVGPALTTVAEIARRAGVQRLTVYSHFPQPKDLFAACQAHSLGGDPAPALLPAAAPSLDGLEDALTGLYAWYRHNQARIGNLERDRRLLPELDELLGETADQILGAAATAYASGLTSDAEAAERVRRLLLVAFQFSSWEKLAESGLDDRAAAALFRRAVACLAAGSSGG